MTKVATMQVTLVFGAVALSLPLSAEESLDRTAREIAPIEQERVSFADLDLREEAGQLALRKRVFVAAKRVCAKSEGLGSPHTFLACAKGTFRNARPQLIAAIDRAKSGGPQLASALVLTSATRAR